MATMGAASTGLPAILTHAATAKTSIANTAPNQPLPAQLAPEGMMVVDMTVVRDRTVLVTFAVTTMAEIRTVAITTTEQGGIAMRALTHDGSGL